MVLCLEEESVVDIHEGQWEREYVYVSARVCNFRRFSGEMLSFAFDT